MDQSPPVLDLIKTVLPFAQSMFGGVVVLIIIFYFGPGLRDILSSIDPGQTEGSFLSHKSYYQNLTKQASLETLDKPLDVMVNHPNPLSEKSKKEITENNEEGLVRDVQKAIDSFVADKEDKKPEKETLRGLLCDAYICLYFERAYQKLLSPQLHLLKKIQGSKGLSITLKEVEKVLKVDAPDDEDYDGPPISMDQWLASLKHLHFITIKEDTVVLRDEGREFINYITDRDYSFKKGHVS